MRYETAGAFRQALEQRLLDRSRTPGASLIRLRKMVAFDRLLARLVRAASGRWVLKGALALDFRLGERGRTTKDMDLVRRDDEEAATEDLLDAADLDLGDFFVFSVEKVASVANPTGDPARFRIRVELAGRVFEEVFVDVGFSDPLGWQPDQVKGSDLLSFAGIQGPVVPAIPLEQQIAEKVHAYSRAYGGGEPSSRVKDLIDLVLVAREMELDARRLGEALEVTFRARGQGPLPARLPLPPANWAVPYRKMAGEVGIDGDVRAGHVVAAALLDPVLAGDAQGRWDPRSARWPPASP